MTKIYKKRTNIVIFLINRNYIFASLGYFCIFAQKLIKMIIEASLSGFLKTLLIILLVIFGIRIIMRIFLPYLMRYFFQRVEKKITEKFQQAQNQQYNYQQKQSTHETNAQPKNPKSSKQVGEYIDFEEVK